MATATCSNPAWLNNARRLLGRRMHRTPSGARWWGLVRLLNHEVGLPLKASAKVADTVLVPGFQTGRLRFAACRDGSASLQVDLQRFHSTANALLAAAFAFANPRPRGRPPSKRHPGMQGVAPVTRIRVEDEPQRLSLLAARLREADARLRGIDPALPFILDAATLRAVPRLALTTREGDVDVMVVAGGKAARSAPAESPRGK